MNERLQHHDSGEKLDLDINVEKNLEHVKEKALESKEVSHDQLEQIRRNIEAKAVSGHEIAVGERETKPASHAFGTHKELKASSYKRTLQHIQSRLHGPEKAFSKTIHRPMVERVSNIGAQTVARPASIMTAGVITFLGSIGSLYFAKHYGFTYNYSWFILLFAGGYALGLVLELAGRLVKRRR